MKTVMVKKYGDSIPVQVKDEEHDVVGRLGAGVSRKFGI